MKCVVEIGSGGALDQVQPLEEDLTPNAILSAVAEAAIPNKGKKPDVYEGEVDADDRGGKRDEETHLFNEKEEIETREWGFKPNTIRWRGILF